MHRTAAALLAAALLLFVAPWLPASAQNAEPQPWGTWVWQTSFGPGLSLPALLTLDKDGTVSVSDGQMFGGLPGATTRYSPLHGVWERTGAGRIGGTSLWLIFDAPSGVLVAIGRCRTALTLTSGGEALEGTMFLETLPCFAGPLGCPDPLDPAAPWLPYPNLPPTGLAVSAKRLHRVPAGPLVP